MITGEFFSNLISPYAPGRVPPTPPGPDDLFAAGEQGGWWDTSDLDNMFADDAGLSPPILNNPIGRINDKSGNGNHLTSKFALGPTLRLDGNGKYYLEAAGTGAARLSSIGAFNIGASDKVSVTWGYYKEVEGVAILVETGVGASGYDSAGILGAFVIADATPVAGCFRNGFSGGTNPPFADGYQVSNSQGILQIATTQYDIGLGTYPTRINGAGIVTTAVGSVTVGNFSATNHLFVNSRGDGALFFNGRWYGGVIRGGASTLAQIQIAEDYLNTNMLAY